MNYTSYAPVYLTLFLLNTYNHVVSPHDSGINILKGQSVCVLTLAVEAKVSMSTGVTVLSSKLRFTHTCIGARVCPTGIPFCACSTALTVCKHKNSIKRVKKSVNKSFIKSNLSQIESNQCLTDDFPCRSGLSTDVNL